MLDLAPAATVVRLFPLSDAPRPAQACWWPRLCRPDYFRDMLSCDAGPHPELLSRMI